MSQPTCAFNPKEAKSGLNQYWYSEVTIQTLIAEACHHATKAAFLSTPSLFFALDKEAPYEGETTDAAHQRRELRKQSKILEFDPLWSQDPGFVHYDFRQPEAIPVQLIGQFDYVVADPPFITEEVWAAYMATAKLLVAPGGKVLFTTVLENHMMLESLWNGPLFIARFRPLVEHLTYQYVCFTNYEATILNRVVNHEIEEADPKVLAAIEMANAVRQSEEAFALQMQSRERSGEQPLPAAAFERERLNEKRVGRAGEGLVSDGRGRTVDWEKAPLEGMLWGHIPAELQPYATGACSEAPAEPTTHEYLVSKSLRSDLDAFKGQIDKLQKELNNQWQCRLKLAKVKKETPQDEAAIAALEREAILFQTERENRLQSMRELAEKITQQEAELSSWMAQQKEGEEETSGSSKELLPAPAYLASLQACVDRYSSVSLQKAALLELASEATGRFKAPIFARMKALLQAMKEMKKPSTH